MPDEPVRRGASRREVLRAIFDEALAAADPGAAVRRHVERRPGGLVIGGEPAPSGARLVLLAAGKAAGGMAAALEELAGERLERGLAVTHDARGISLRRVELREAGHPVPDERSERAAQRALELVETARPEDVLVVALSGGASALLGCPVEGLELSDLAGATIALLEAGANIDETNAVRKHLSAVAGGRLAARARPRRIELGCLSDVLGDRLDVIGSGPCTPDPSTYADALRVLARRRLRARMPRRALELLEEGARGRRPETLKPGDERLEGVRARILAGNGLALEAAHRAAARRGLRPARLTAGLRGEARVAGRRLAALAQALRPSASRCLLAGGETTVTVRGPGKGGRSQELALAAALELDGAPAERGPMILAAGTDGSDGPTDAAGAFADGGTAARGAARGRDAGADLDRNDAYGFFAAEGGLLRTGPTGTNVMDLVLVHVEPACARGSPLGRSGHRRGAQGPVPRAPRRR